MNGTFGRGTVGVDLNAIPKAAVERIEILRDGAAAQYGSEAIAGVINIVLKDNTEGLQLSSLVGTTAEGDGDQIKTDVNYGFALGDGGYVNVTGEFFDRGRTARGGASCNAACPLAGGAELYGFGGLSYRRGKATGFYRLPGSQPERVVYALYPDGFLPQINPDIEDRSFSAGVRGARGAWDVDFSLTRAATVSGGTSRTPTTPPWERPVPSPSMPAASGSTRRRGTSTWFGPWRWAPSSGRPRCWAPSSASRTTRSRPASSSPGPWAAATRGTWRGWVPASTTTPRPAADSRPPARRSSVASGPPARSTATATASAPTPAWKTRCRRCSWSTWGRFERYSDFGNTSTGKVALRLELNEALALRGPASNGFRAPSLHQVWVNSVSTQFVADEQTGELVPREVLTAHNNSAVAKAFGIGPLAAETSVNLSGGITARPLDNLSITADYYRIEIDDRIVLTSRFSAGDEAYAAILEPFRGAGVTQASSSPTP